MQPPTIFITNMGVSAGHLFLVFRHIYFISSVNSLTKFYKDVVDPYHHSTSGWVFAHAAL
jgi:hypothetical protein